MPEYQSEVVAKVRILAGITDDKQDAVISTLEEMTRDQLAMMVDERSVPPALEAIVLQVTLARFNRLGNEGMQSYSQEGESITYPASDFDAYASVIDRYIADSKRGKIVFFKVDKVGEPDNEI
ncbi:phage head-tail connector protein [Lactobacillus sp. AN1001]